MHLFYWKKEKERHKAGNQLEQSTWMFGVAMRTEGIIYGGGGVENFLLKIAVNFSSIVDTFPGFLIIIHIDAVRGQHKSTISRNQSLFIALRGGKGVYKGGGDGGGISRP